MGKMSEIMVQLAEKALALPCEKTSREGVAAALLLATFAWNRAVDPFRGDQTEYFREALRALERENPKCLQELKSADVEAVIRELVSLKVALYPADERVVRSCGFLENNNVRVEWGHRGIEGVN
jgi:hypothetical protein